MIIFDYNQVAISNLMEQIGFSKTEVEEGLVRHMILNTIRTYVKKFKKTHGSNIIIACDNRNYWRKEIFPNYKASRKKMRETSGHDWNKIFECLNKIRDELKEHSPYKVIEIDTCEADDIIAYLSTTLIEKPEDKIFIVSSDKDFLQLVSNQVTVYRPMEKKYYTEEVFRAKYKISPKNFILYKILLGDQSDKIKGIKGLGEKGLLKKFPELKERIMSFDDLLEVCEGKFKDHVVYSRVLLAVSDLEKSYKVMDLSKPLLDEKDKEYLNEIVNSNDLNYLPEEFISLYNEDKLGGMIRNLEYWLDENFKKLVINK